MTSIYCKRLQVKNNIAIYFFHGLWSLLLICCYYFIFLFALYCFYFERSSCSFGSMAQSCLFLFCFENDMTVPVGFLFDLYWYANDRIQNRKVMCVCTHISTRICGLCDLFTAVTPINNSVINVIMTTLVSRQYNNKIPVTSRD